MTGPTAAAGSRAVRRRQRLPRTVWLVAAVAFLGSSADNYLLFLLLWIAGPQGWSGVDTALVLLALRLPVLASGLVAGRSVDRWGARPVVAADVGGRCLLLLALLAAAVRVGEVPLLPVLVLGAVCGALAPGSYAGVRWLVPRLVGDESLGRANAVVSLSDQLPLLVGAALVGPALSLLGPVAGLAVPVALLGLAVLVARRLPVVGTWGTHGGRGEPEHGGRLRTSRAGPGGVGSRVVALVALSTAYYFAYGPFETASPAWVRHDLGAGAGAYSLLWTLFGVGAVASLPLAPALARRRPGVVNAVGALAWGLLMLPVLVVDTPQVAAALFLVGGLVWGPYTTVETSALQRWVDPARHGAVFGTQRALLATATPLGAACGALAVTPDRADVVLAAAAAGCAAAGLLALGHRGLRRSG